MREFEELRINNKVVYKPQRVQKVFHNAILNRDENGYRDFLFGGSAKPGKLVSTNTLIPTPTGWTTMGEIRIGDKVYSDEGEITKVIWKSEIELFPDAYEIEFDNGEKIIADACHLWRTKTEKEREWDLKLTKAWRENRKSIRPSRAKNNPLKPWAQKSISESNKKRRYEYKQPIKGNIRTTHELFLTQKNRDRNNHSIDSIVTSNLNKYLLVDPYLLGLWLGDGSSDSGKITMLDSDFWEVISYTNEEVEHIYYAKNRKQKTGLYKIKGLKEKLKEIGLINDKRIPMTYLRSSFHQRLELLRGLLDTDGSVGKRGECEIQLSKQDLAEDVCELIATLGIKYRTAIRKLSLKNPNHKDSHRINFVCPYPAFKLKRKLDKQCKVTNGRSQKFYIKNIKKVPPVPMQCLQVAHPSGMYLIGRTFIPTHNSYALRWEAHRNGLEYENIKILLIRSSFPELENTHLLQLQFDFSPGIISYNGQRHRATYLSTNSILQFGYGDKLTDFSQYLSTEWDVLLIDELTTIPFEFSYLLRSRLAGSRKDFTPFWANASNPGNRAHASVKAYFMDKNPDKEIYTKYKESEVLYIHSTVYDNLVLLERDPEVLKRLQQLPPREQQKYLYGNWDIFEGAMFNFNREVHLIDRENYLSYDHILSSFNVMASIDYGNVTVVALGAKDSNGNVIIFDEWKDKGSSRIEKIQSLHKFLEVRNMLNIDIIADTNMWIPDAFDVEDTNVAAYDFIEAGFNLYPVSKSGKGIKNRSYRIMCNDTIQTALHYKFEDNEIKVQPKLKFYSRCKYIIESLSNLIADPNDPDDIADNQDDHGYDALKYLYMNFMTPVKRKDEDKYEWLKKARLKKMKQLSQQTTVLSE